MIDEWDQEDNGEDMEPQGMEKASESLLLRVSSEALQKFQKKL